VKQQIRWIFILLKAKERFAVFIEVVI